MLKRLLDLSASFCGLFFLMPLLAGIAVWIKLDSPGPIFYRGLRAARGGRTFRIFKFRTMVINADKIGGASTSDHDPRITRVGHFIRKFKFDELPQLINVLWGSMSLVGPRPQVMAYVESYTPAERVILDVRPGITDWASIWNSDEGAVLARYPDPDRAYDELIHPTKTQLQLRYVKEHSVLTDIRIIFYTLARIVWKNWVPAELRDVPRPWSDAANETANTKSIAA